MANPGSLGLGGLHPPALAVPWGEGGSVPAGISLDVDADRDGVVEKNSPNKVPRPPPPHGKSTGPVDPEPAEPLGCFR